MNKGIFIICMLMFAFAGVCFGSVLLPSDIRSLGPLLNLLGVITGFTAIGAFVAIFMACIDSWVTNICNALKESKKNG